MRTLYLISYDIPDDKRRLKVMHLLEGYGERVQYSVFEVWADEKQIDHLRRQLARWVKARQGEKESGGAEEGAISGSVRIYPLCAACREKREVWGEGQPTSEVTLHII
ncbi:MAG TPA: CRISPR-associated endonuclease Cas2 [Anaerolineae bacterium]|nr:CRISPR-associated endonuclease Cas2 [Anaerolineae bacterium]HQH38024.1 CRISPR-associated endonuclease Cas2 [Anaerolineae bacterium]